MEKYIKELLDLQKEYAEGVKDSSMVSSRKLRTLCKPLVKLGFTDAIAVSLVMGTLSMSETIEMYESLRKSWEKKVKCWTGLTFEDTHTDASFVVTGEPYENKYEVMVLPCRYEGKKIEIPVSQVGLLGYYNIVF